ncbi:MAG TPA: tetratricopeptide repeat protein [Rhizomicrobium sp.]
MSASSSSTDVREAHLWAQTFDGAFADIFRIQDEITSSIVAALASHLENVVAPDVARARPESLEAWELCQRARAAFNHVIDADARRTAEALFRKAVKKDPNYAVAWVSLGTMIAFRWIVEPGIDGSADRDEARICVERAIRLAPNDPDVLAGRGRYLMAIGQPQEAVPFLERARQLNPCEVAYRAQLARALVNSGRAAEALKETEAVLRLSPLDPLASGHYYQMAEIHLALDHFAESEAWARRALAGGLRSAALWFVLGNALGAQGKTEEAHAAIREAVNVSPGTTLASMEHWYRRLGIEKTRLDGLLAHLKMCWPPELR